MAEACLAARCSPLAQAKAVYDREPCARSFEEDLALHLEHGHVHSTPAYFIMGRPVDTDFVEDLILDPVYHFTHPNCWLIWLYAGSLSLAFRHFNDNLHLPWIAFQRRNQLRFYNSERLYAKITGLAARRNPLLQGQSEGTQAALAARTSDGG